MRDLNPEFLPFTRQHRLDDAVRRGEHGRAWQIFDVPTRMAVDAVIADVNAERIQAERIARAIHGANR